MQRFIHLKRGHMYECVMNIRHKTVAVNLQKRHSNVKMINVKNFWFQGLGLTEVIWNTGVWFFLIRLLDKYMSKKYVKEQVSGARTPKKWVKSKLSKLFYGINLMAWISIRSAHWSGHHFHVCVYFTPPFLHHIYLCLFSIQPFPVTHSTTDIIESPSQNPRMHLSHFHCICLVFLGACRLFHMFFVNRKRSFIHFQSS